MKFTPGLILCLVCLTAPAWSQLRVFPLANEDGPATRKTQSAKTHAATALSLPFWEDFSGSKDFPDTLKWQNSENVRINDGLSFTPPSVKVASFDGLDANGQPYGAGSNGMVDSLSSVPIDLGGYSFADDIFMSFYYQAGGLGDLPDDGNDSLRLEFYTVDSTWVSVWPMEGELIYDGEYHQVVLPVADAEFLHENFRFRFQSVGNLTGMYDIWNLDYIYINRNRSLQDTSYPDRAMNEPLSSFLRNYYTVPYTHYMAEENGQPAFWIRNLVTAPPIQNKAYFYLFNYDIDVTDTLGNVTSFTSSQLVEPFESPIGIGVTEEVILREPLADFSSVAAADSARVTIEIILDAEDNKTINDGGDYDPSKYAPIDFRQNDTLRSTYYLTDHYAYDDGIAEAAAGLNAQGDFIAVKFDLLPDSAQLTGVDMYFPYAGIEPSGRSVDVIVWQDESGFPGEILHRQQFIIRREGGLNNLIRYEFDRPVFIAGSYFVGYRQNTNGDMGLGLDVNTFSGDKIFYNLDGTWQMNTLVSGSVMLRPVFGTINMDEVVSAEQPLSTDLQVWPNPSVDGIFNIRGNLRMLQIIDLRGSVLQQITPTPGISTYRLDMSSFNAGLYILQAETTSGTMRNIKLLRR